MKRHDSPRHRPRTTAAAIAVSGLALIIFGCGSAPAPTHFHTLMPPASAIAGRGGSAGTALDWQVMPVKIPAQVDQPQWVLRSADGGLVMLEQERWIAPLGDEIHAAVVERLSQTLGPPGTTATATRWLIRIDVRRFDLAAGSETRLAADWSVSREGAAVNCHLTAVNQPGSSGYAALSKALQEGVSQLADAIGTALKQLSKGQTVTC